jgi:phosphohistidine swiveling domain-containing protein
VTETTTDTTAITWSVPAGGQWELETQHLPGAVPRVFQERGPVGLRNGFEAASKRYGLPIEYFDVRFVNDHCYMRVRPVGAPEPKPGKATSPPPKVVMWALARLHPELRRRARTARRALAERIWHDDLRRWESGLRDEMLEIGRGLQAEDLEAMDDEALVGHLHRATDHMVRGFVVHFDLMLVHNIPLGRLVAGCRRWGIRDADALGLLAGSSPASAGSSEALRRIGAACRAAGVDPRSLDEVRAASPEARVALDDYLADHAWRALTDYSPRARTLIELPDVLVQAIRAATDAAPRPEPDAAPFRARVPESERERFDDLLADARRCYGIRDDNVGLTGLWPVGLVRRAILEVGRRLVDRGVLDEPTQALALGEQELADALHGDASLGDVAKERVARGIAYEADGAPLVLGDSEGGDPDFSAFPAAMAELTAAVIDTVVLEGMLTPDTPTDWSGTGIGVSGEPYTGRACVAASPEDALTRLEPGDVLVTTHTTPAYEAVMGIAGAVVTEQGGLMSHTALVTREHGIPAVVGVTAATTAIPDGAKVEVDPAAGQVRILT